MSATSPSASVAPGPAAAVEHRGRTRSLAALARRHWPLLVLLALGAALRFATIGLQSFWYDEAYTPVHVLRPSLGATLHGVMRTENSPPLWYIAAWGWSRVFGTGVVALRSLSALAGVATVWVAWLLGVQVGRRRTAIVLTAIVACNPLLIWYAQEARVYALFALIASVSLLFFVRAWNSGSTRDLIGWVVSSGLALVTHYFVVFLLIPQALLLIGVALPRARARLASLRRDGGEPRMSRAAALWSVAAVGACGLAVVPLILGQGGHGTQWIGRWLLSDRLVAIPGYYFLGAQSPVFGHGLLLACAAPVLVSLGLIPGLEPDERRAGTLMLLIGAVGIGAPIALALVGVDYLTPRNLIAAWIPLTAALAVLLSGRRAGAAGSALAALVCLAGLAITLDIDLTPRLQRGDWHGVARIVGPGAPDRAVVTVELGSAPLEYYLPGLRFVRPGTQLTVSEVDYVGYGPLRSTAGRPPTAAFRLSQVRSTHGLYVYRFRAATPQSVAERTLRAHSITDTGSETLAWPATAG